MLLTPEDYRAMGFEGGEDDQTCEKALARAERMVNLLTDGKCNETEASGEQLDNLRQATAAQAEMYLLQGGQPVAGTVSVGDYSCSVDCDGINAVSPLAMTILKLSGLFYRCVESR